MADSLATQDTNTGTVPSIPTSSLSIPEDAQLPADSTDMSSDLEKAARGVPKAGDIYRASLRASQLQKDATERDYKETAKFADEQHDQLADIVKEKMPSSVQIGKPPAQPENNPFQRFGSFASVLGIFASAFTKKPIINAMNASATAMNAQRRGDMEAYDTAYQEWKDSTELALKRHQTEVEDLDKILDVWKNDQALGAAKLKAWAAMNGSDAAKAVADVGSAEELQKLIDTGTKAQQEIETQKSLIEERKAQTNLLLEKKKVLEQGGGLSSAQKVKVVEQDGVATDTLDDIDKALSLMDNSFALAGVGGEVQKYTEPLGNIMGSDSTQAAQFRQAIGEIKIKLPGLLRDSAGGKGLSADTGYLDDIVGGVGFKNSTANTYDRLTNLKNDIMKMHNRFQGLLQKDKIMGEQDTEDHAWQDAPLVAPDQ